MCSSDLAIRSFFDERTQHLKSDKLSQAYLEIKLNENDLNEYKISKISQSILTDKPTNLSLDELKVMFKTYCQQPSFTLGIELPKEVNSLKKCWINRPEGSVRFVLQSIIIASAFSFFSWLFNLKGTEEHKYLQYWQVINTSSGQTAVGGRNEALHYLGESSWPIWWYIPECKRDDRCLVGVKIQGANLQKVNLEGANLISSEFSGTNFRDAKMKGVNFKESQFGSIADSKGNIFASANFKNANLRGATFISADLKGVDFENADLRGATFTSAQLKGAKFKNAKVKGATFLSAKDLDLKGANEQE